MSEENQIKASKNMTEVFADGVVGCGQLMGMIRIDLFTLSATEKDQNGAPAPQICQRIIMSVDGFLASLQTLDDMRRRVLQREAVSAPPAADASRVESAAPTSPNFR